MKTCTRCEQTLPLEDFAVVKNSNKTDTVYRRSMCKPCKRAYLRDYYAKDPKRHAKYAANKRRERKTQLIKHFGGACLKCGYSAYWGALSFHHRDPSEKKFELGRAVSSRSLADLIIEAEKCDLLCLNCHAEIERVYFEDEF